jgi:hypothetical protein
LGDSAHGTETQTGELLRDQKKSAQKNEKQAERERRNIERARDLLRGPESLNKNEVGHTGDEKKQRPEMVA